jgi:Ca2+-binding RTX toxin-like protein
VHSEEIVMRDQHRIDGLQPLQAPAQTDPAEASGFVLTAAVLSAASTAAASPSTPPLYAASDAPATLDADYVGTPGNDSQNGTASTDFMYGQGGNDTLRGLGSFDVLDGGDGNDLLDGGEGDDSLWGQAGNDTLIGGPGIDTLKGGDGFDVAAYDNETNPIRADVGAARVVVVVGGVGVNEFLDAIEGIAGGDGNDTIDGSSTGNLLLGRGGDDTVKGADGVDSLYGDGGNDVLNGGSGADLVDGGPGNDTIVSLGGETFDSVHGGDGVDVLDHSATTLSGATFNFAAGTITVAGIAASTVVSGIEVYLDGSGSNTIYSSGDGRYQGNDGNDTLHAAAGGVGETLDGGGGTDWLDTTHWIHFYSINLATGVTNYEESFVNFENANTGSGSDTIIGTAGANAITTNGGNDSVLGDAGNDTINGGAGNDTLEGGAGTDEASYVGATGAVSVNLGLAGAQNTLGAGTDTLLSFENIVGSSFNDTLTGTASGNVISGGAGIDSINGGAGSDTVNGDAGNDRLSGGLASSTVNGGADNDTITDVNLNSPGDVFDGGAGEDTLVADFAFLDAVLFDLASGWMRFSGTTFDTISNIEHLTVGGGADVIGSAVNNAITIRDTGSSNNNTIRAGAGNDQVVAGIGNDSVGGEAGDDRLNGGIGNDTLDGGAGIDTMIGFEGSDTYHVDNPADQIFEIGTLAAEIDTVVSSITLTLGTTLEKLTLTGTAAIDGTGNTLANRIAGNTGANLLTGDAGNDTLSGGAGADTMVGGAGNDICYVGIAGDRVIETSSGGSADLVYSSVTRTLDAWVEKLVLTGTAALNGTGNGLANTLTGNGAANLLAGGSGNDTLSGGAGNDRLDGGLGNDSLIGGSGADLFRFASALNASTNVDRISGFVAAADTIQLENAVFVGVGFAGALAAGAFRAGSGAGDANDRVIYHAATGQLFFDPDGTGAAAKLLFAIVAPGTAVTAADFVIT